MQQAKKIQTGWIFIVCVISPKHVVLRKGRLLSMLAFSFVSPVSVSVSVPVHGVPVVPVQAEYHELHPSQEKNGKRKKRGAAVSTKPGFDVPLGH